MTVKIGKVEFANELPIKLIAGPCVVESRDHCVGMAEKLMRVTGELLPRDTVVFKASWDKANRTRGLAFRGASYSDSGYAFEVIRRDIGFPVLTDIHEPRHAAQWAEQVDCLQIPAMLMRQTDLLDAAGQTGIPVNIKKSQAASPDEMVHAVEKVAGPTLITERGTRFGYGDLVVDMRGLETMRSLDVPLIFDATHSVQRLGDGKTSGRREFIHVLARAAAAVGIAGIFVETHDNPSQALSDADSQLPIEQLPRLLDEVLAIDRAVKGY